MKIFSLVLLALSPVFGVGTVTAQEQYQDSTEVYEAPQVNGYSENVTPPPAQDTEFQEPEKIIDPPEFHQSAEDYPTEAYPAPNNQ